MTRRERLTVAASAEKLLQLKITAPPSVLADTVEEVPYTWLVRFLARTRTE